MPIEVDVEASAENFDEAGYLALNPDVAKNLASVVPGGWASGRAHFDRAGHKEGRSLRQLRKIAEVRKRKLDKLASRLRGDQLLSRIGDKFNFLSPAMQASIARPANTPDSQNMYDEFVLSAIDENENGLVLDCGAGFRKIYYPNVVNYEIVDYDTTDVIGLGEELPFINDTFDAVISISVLEHVRDPLKCASELARVLKPGGKIICNVPFLGPYHGYPHHYFNMTGQGLRTLFEDRRIEVEFHEVIDSMLPIWTLTWIVQSWADGLKNSREAFLDLPLRTLLNEPNKLLGEQWVRELSREKNFELACGTLLIGKKV